MPSRPPGAWTTALPLRGRWALYFLRGVVLLLVLALAPLWSDLREGLPSLADALPGSLRAGISPRVSSYYCGMAGGSGLFTRMELSIGHIQIHWATLAGPGSWKQLLLSILMDASACAAALILLFWALTPPCAGSTIPLPDSAPTNEPSLTCGSPLCHQRILDVPPAVAERHSTSPSQSPPLSGGRGASQKLTHRRLPRR